MSINIAIADDEVLIRNLFVSKLSSYNDIEIMGQAGNGLEVMDILHHSCPDVLLLDLSMPKMSGLLVLGKIREEKLPVRVLVISMHDSDEIIKEAISSGAMGFIQKSEEWAGLYTAINTVARGDFYYTDRLNFILRELTSPSGPGGIKIHKDDIDFNEREIAIIRLLNDGLSSSEISRRIFCSRSTVDRIRQELIHRVGAKNTNGLLSYAARKGLVGKDILSM